MLPGLNHENIFEVTKLNVVLQHWIFLCKRKCYLYKLNLSNVLTYLKPLETWLGSEIILIIHFVL